MDSTTPPPINPQNIPGQAVKWPKTVGIIALVFGILGVLQTATAPLGIMMMEKQMDAFTTAGASEEDVASYFEKFKSMTTQSSISLGVLAILLSVGGLMLLKKRRGSSLVLQIWAVLKILVGGFFSFQNVSLTRLQMDIMTAGGAMKGAGAAEMNQVFDFAIMGGLIFGMLWLAAFPIFLLVWLNRSVVKEEVQRW